MKLRSPCLAVLAAACVALAGASGAHATDVRASRYYEDALQRYEKGDTAGAVIQLKNVLKIDSAMLPAQVLLGKALLADGQSGPAEAAFNEALRLGVDRAEVIVPLAQAVVAQARHGELFDQPRFADGGLPRGARHALLLVKAGAAADTGDRQTALKLIDESRSLDPSQADSWLAEVSVRVRAGELQSALAAADKALALQPGAAQPLYIRGTVAHVQGDLDGALAYYAKALALEPAHTEALVSRAGVLLDQGQLAGARRDVAALRKSAPGDPRGAYLAALIAEREGRAADVRAALGDVTALLDPVPLEAFRYRTQLLMLGGLAHYGLKEAEKARPYLEAALRSMPGNPAAKLLARIYLDSNDAGRAVDVLETYLHLQPDDTQAILLLASAQMVLGRSARATSLLQSAIGRADRPAYRSALGLSLLGTGRAAAAIPELEDAVRRDPGQIQAATALAAMYLQRGQAPKAVQVVDALVKRYPDQPGLLHLLGTARLRTGDVAGARSALERAARLDANFLAPQIELARLDASVKAFDAALARLNAVLARDAGNVETMTALGQIQASRGLLDDAGRWFEKADDHSGVRDLDAGVRLVEFRLANGQFAQAQEALQRLTRRDPEALPVLLTQARVALALGDRRAAQTTLTRASGLAAYDVGTLVDIASLQLAAGHPAGAVHSLGKALDEAPGNLRAQVLLAQAELRTGNVARADELAHRIATEHAQNGIGHTLLGEVALARGQRSAAIESLRKAHQIDQDSASLLRLLQALEPADGAAAIRLGEQWLKAHPRDVAVLRAIGDARARAGQFPAARAAYEQLVKLRPDDADATNNLANLMILLEDGAALRVAEQALALKPGAAHIIGTVGWAAFKAGQNERALQLLRDARLRDPANPDTRYFLAAVLAQAGRRAEARQELEAALQNPRGFGFAKEAERLSATLK